MPRAAPAASLSGLGDLAGGAFESVVRDVSDDGSTAVGVSQSGSGSEAFRWQAGAMAGLGDLSGGEFSSEAHGVSANGAVVVGDSASGSTEAHAFRWQSGSLQDLGAGFLAGAFDVSADGQVVVGVRALGSTSDPDPEAVRWVGGSLSGLGDLPGGAFASRAVAVSADGTVIVGSGDDGSGAPVGFRWQGGGMTALPSLAGGYTTLLANGLSADGQVIVGEDDDPVLGVRAFRLEAGLVTLLPGMRRALDASADGSVVVGTIGPGAASEAALWTSAGGTRRLADVLTEDYQIGDHEGWTLEQAVAISNDGLVIVGNGRNPLGLVEAWRASLAPGCGDGLDNDGDGLTDLADPGCDDAADLSEHAPTLPCDDFADLDGDGLADFPDDPGCASPTDASENTPALVCDDGLDDDGDGLVDMADPGCSDPFDPSERSAALVCDDGVDNDGDTGVDFPGDPDCTSPFDPSEASIPGRVLAEARLSATQGGFGGALVDGQGLGTAVAGPGDLNGDGRPDLVAGAPGTGASAHPGALFRILLDASGSAIGDAPLAPAGPLDPGDQLGRALAALGDLDGNGQPDLAAGASGDDDGGGGRGAVWTLWLDPAGAVAADAKISATAGGFAGPLDDLDSFGSALAPLGDLDGNGSVDLAVGAPADADGGFAKGAAWLLRRDASGAVVSSLKISATSGGFGGALDFFDLFGSALAAVGDLDGDGLTELAVGAPLDDDGGADRGAVWILFLHPDGTVRAHQKLSSTSAGLGGALADGDAFGSALAAVGDLDGDGTPDLAVGAPGDDEGGPDRGAVWLLLLEPDGQVGTRTRISALQGPLQGPLSDGDRFGSALAALGDVGGDGGSDLAVGAPFADDGGSDRGSVYVLQLERAVCGNGAVEFAEVCDDGNTAPADGCSALCRVQDGFALAGTAQGGSVSLQVGGVPVQVTTSAGQAAGAVLAALAQAIASDPSLQAQGVSSSVDGGLLIVDGALIEDAQVDDPGFAPPAVPALPLPAVALLAAVLLAALRTLRRTPRA